MLRRFLRFILSILVFELVCFILLGFWIVHDGSHDVMGNVDAVFVPGYSEINDGLLSPELTARLDRAAALFNSGKCSYIIVRGVTPPGEDDESEAMSRYLQAHSVPEDSIIQDHPGVKGPDSADTLVNIMQQQKISSLLLITDYYRLVHLKVVLAHAGEKNLGQVHIGEWKKDDLMKVAHEDFAIFKDMYDWFIEPEVKVLVPKITQEVQSIEGSAQSEIQSLQKK